FGWVPICRIVAQKVVVDDCVRKVWMDGGGAKRGRRAVDAVAVVTREIVGESEAADRLWICRLSSIGVHQRPAVMIDGVVIDHDVARLVPDQQEPAVPTPSGAADVIKQVVTNPNVLRQAGHGRAVVAEDVYACGCVTDDVVLEGDILHRAPVAVVVRVSWREDDRVSRLAMQPVRLEDVVLDSDAASVLQFEDVLYEPPRARARWRRCDGARRAAI